MLLFTRRKEWDSAVADIVEKSKSLVFSTMLFCFLKLF